MNKEIEEKNQKLILDYLKTKKNDNTKKSYGHDLKLFSEFVDKDLMGVDIFNVTDYFNSIEDKSPATFNRRLLSVRDFYGFYIEAGYFIKNNPTNRVKRQKVDSEGKTKPLAIDQTSKLIKLIKGKIKMFNKENDIFSRNLQIRNLSLITCDVNGGFRASELLELTFDRLDIENCKIELLATDTKGKDKRLVNFDVKVFDYLKDYLEIRNEFLKGKESKYVFVSKSGLPLGYTDYLKIVKDYGKEIGIENLVTHDLRGTYIVNVYRATGNDLVKTQKIVNHKSLAQTRRYTNFEIDETELIKLPTARL